MINKFLEWLNSKPKENVETVNPLARDIDYDSLSPSSLILLLKSRDSEIANYERLLRTLSNDSNNGSSISDGEKPKEINKEPEEKELVLNKINRSNYRTIGAVLSNRSRDRDKYKFRPLNKAK